MPKEQQPEPPEPDDDILAALHDVISTMAAEGADTHAPASGWSGQLSPRAQAETERAALTNEYEDRFQLARQDEIAAFSLAIRALVRHGRPAYFSQSNAEPGGRG